VRIDIENHIVAVGAAQDDLSAERKQPVRSEREGECGVS
jgi:hypothetical protein